MMARRTFIDDPSGDGVVLVAAEVDADRFVVRVDGAGELPVLIELARSDGRLIARRTTMRCGTVDVSHDPVSALRALFEDDPHPGLLDHLIEQAARFSAGIVGQLSDHAAEQLLLSGHPALSVLAGAAALRVPSALPKDISEVFRRASLRDATEAAVPGGRSSRQLRDAVVASWTRDGVLRLRDVSMLAAGRTLGDSQLALVLSHDSPVEPWAVVTRRVADACSGVLARLGRANHASVLRQLVGHPSGLAHMRLIAAAGQAGVDTAGIRGGDRLDWLLRRCAEALERPVSGTPIGHLHGRRIGDSGRRVRVVTTKGEFSHVASRMSNCLATYGPTAMERGSSFAVVVSADGEPQQALEVRGGRVLQWAGPSNQMVPAAERRTVLEALSRPRAVDAPVHRPTAGQSTPDATPLHHGRDARIEVESAPRSA